MEEQETKARATLEAAVAWLAVWAALKLYSFISDVGSLLPSNIPKAWSGCLLSFESSRVTDVQ